MVDCAQPEADCSAVTAWLSDHADLIDWTASSLAFLGVLFQLLRLWFQRPKRTIGLSYPAMVAALAGFLFEGVLSFIIHNWATAVPSGASCLVIVAILTTMWIYEHELPREMQAEFEDLEHALDYLQRRNLISTEMPSLATDHRSYGGGGGAPRKVIHCSRGECRIVVLGGGGASVRSGEDVTENDCGNTDVNTSSTGTVPSPELLGFHHRRPRPSVQGGESSGPQAWIPLREYRSGHGDTSSAVTASDNLEVFALLCRPRAATTSDNSSHRA